MKSLKVLPLLFLALLCACLLTGCGKTENGETDAADDGMIYTASFTPVIWKGQEGLEPLALTEDGVYVSCYEKVSGTEEYRNNLYFVDRSGAYKPFIYDRMALPEDGDGRKDYSVDSYLQRLFVLPDGRLTLLETVYRSWSEGDGEDDMHWDSQYWIRVLDAEGKELSAAPLEFEQSEDNYLNTYGAVMDPQGRIWINSDQQVSVFAPDGSLAATVETEDWVNQLVSLSDGRVGGLSWGMDGIELMILDEGKNGASQRIGLEEYYTDLMRVREGA